MRVYLIRHAQSEENALDMRGPTTTAAFNAVLRRSPEALLTPLGQEQAAAVAERLAACDIATLYCSPFTRALATAATIGERLGLAPTVVAELREVMPPPLAGERQRLLRDFWLRSYVALLRPRPDGESWVAAYRRASQVWSRLTAGLEQPAAVVSHRGLISLILLSLRSSRSWRVVSRELRNGGVTIIERRGLGPLRPGGPA